MTERLTTTERETVVESMERYPAGVPSSCWGYDGPLNVHYGSDDRGACSVAAQQPHEVDLSTLRKYG